MENIKGILLVEDNVHDQFFFKQALAEIKNARLLYIAANGKEALDKLEGSLALPDIIITDINMPVMDGFECIHKIVNNPVIKHIPVIVLSSDTKHIETVRKIGAKAFITKPIDYAILHRQLKHVIDIDLILDSHLIDHTFLIGFAMS